MSTEEKTDTKLQFHWIKGPDFRTIHVDGAIGSITPRGYIHMALYSERPAIPQKTVHTLNLNENKLGPEILEEQVTRGGIVRQMEIDGFLDFESATSLRDWLNARLSELKQIKSKKN